MKKFLLLICALPTIAMAATHTVSTRYDEITNPGSLRHIVSIAQSGDSIVIPNGLMTVVVDSQLVINKSLILNGNGNTLQVSTPNASLFRVFQVGEGMQSVSFKIYNTTMRGGNVSNRTADVKDLMNCGGIGLVMDSAKLYLYNCRAMLGAGNYAGAFYGTERSHMEFNGCLIAQNRATSNNAGAVYNLGTLKVDNCIFDGNSAVLDGGAVVTNLNSATIRNSYFYGNQSASSTSANNGGAYFNTNKGSGTSVTFENCTFENNVALNKGAGAFTASGQSTTYFTNCTFSGNTNTSSTGAGALYSRNSYIHMINCTVAGNTSPSGTGGITIETTSPTLTLINTIVTHNYSGTVTSDIQITAGKLAGTNNVVGKVAGVNNGLAGAISFSYSPESVLFAQYSTTGLRVPVLGYNGGYEIALGETTKTIALAANTPSEISVATEAGVKAYTGYTIPTLDQRGFMRDANYPCVGAYELDGIGSSIDQTKTQSLVLFPNPARTELNIAVEGTVLSSEIYSVTGQHVQSNGNETCLPVSDLNSGLYLIKVKTNEGTVTRQFVKAN